MNIIINKIKDIKFDLKNLLRLTAVTQYFVTYIHYFKKLYFFYYLKIY